MTNELRPEQSVSSSFCGRLGGEASRNDAWAPGRRVLWMDYRRQREGEHERAQTRLMRSSGPRQFTKGARRWRLQLSSEPTRMQPSTTPPIEVHSAARAGLTRNSRAAPSPPPPTQVGTARAARASLGMALGEAIRRRPKASSSSSLHHPPRKNQLLPASRLYTSTPRFFRSFNPQFQAKVAQEQTQSARGRLLGRRSPPVPQRPGRDRRRGLD